METLERYVGSEVRFLNSSNRWSDWGTITNVTPDGWISHDTDSAMRLHNPAHISEVDLTRCQ